MRVLVCGGRDYRHSGIVDWILDRVHERTPIETLIHGGATGADTLAGEWATKRGVFQVRFPIRKETWHRLGKAAGSMRNQHMLETAKPNLGIAFPGGSGTEDMCTRLRSAKIELMDLR